ncbi:hypothetical protein [Mycobacterium xenopi]|uniref:hypothetical protein n=1 Tax=Mycobacterium xenopi TaxID=1789 RepID=UPI001E2D4D87|nr:hypothetical protein [Mycobacterium xenopi]MDA3641290.1 hypothetical protein [Mycobacterium xenopi]MDA3659034.1 hypothetical protein [Mycobacterium xenopi]MDA3663501.1 hypothetical protein [Mycobacterium xenopi]
MRRVVALSAPQDGGGSVRRGRLAAGLSSIARVRHPSASGRPRWRSLIVVAAVVWALLAVGAHGALPEEHHGAHAHPLLSSLDHEFVVDVGHAHLVDGSTLSHHPEQFATAVLPQRPTTALIALALVVAAVAFTGVLSYLVASPGRGPPPRLALVLTGQARLTRFCLARR